MLETKSSDISSTTIVVLSRKPIFRLQQIETTIRQSSSSNPTSSNQSILYKFVKIKNRNKNSKSMAYNQFWKKTSSTKNIFLLA